MQLHTYVMFIFSPKDSSARHKFLVFLLIHAHFIIKRISGYYKAVSRCFWFNVAVLLSVSCRNSFSVLLLYFLQYIFIILLLQLCKVIFDVSKWNDLHHETMLLGLCSVAAFLQRYIFSRYPFLSAIHLNIHLALSVSDTHPPIESSPLHLIVY